jgi:putative addiction module killer protein
MNAEDQPGRGSALVRTGGPELEARARIRVRLNRIRLGNFGDCKAVAEGVMELRMDFGPGYRVYFGQDGDVLVILLCGGDKRTQMRDIVTAKQYWQSYKRRTS